MLTTSILVIAASASAAAAASAQGFNWASNGNDQSNFESGFKAESDLPGAPGFNSARLYTMIQSGTQDTVISAIPAAISTKTTLLLGLWASAGQEAFDKELSALKKAISQYGKDFADLVVGVSVGSEDLYRDTDTSKITNKDPNPGASPDTLVSYISQVRKLIKGTVLATKPVGHVDVTNAFANSSNKALIAACDFLGMDEYPYYETTEKNSIDNAYDLFYKAYDKISKVSGGVPIWVTETGWPYIGAQSNDAVASVANAERYWKDVGCSLFGKTNVWWFTLADGVANPAFGIRGNSIASKPLFDLSCDKKMNNSHSGTGSHGSNGKPDSLSATDGTSGKSHGMSGNGTDPSNSHSHSGSSSGSGSGSGSGSSNSTFSMGSGNPKPTSGSGSAGGSQTGAAPRLASAGLGAAMCVVGCVSLFFL